MGEKSSSADELSVVFSNFSSSSALAMAPGAPQNLQSFLTIAKVIYRSSYTPRTKNRRFCAAVMAQTSPFQGVYLHHVARETSDVQRMVEFYEQVFGFKNMGTPQSFGDFNVVWLHLPPSYSLHIVERDDNSRLPESPFVVPKDAKADPSALWRGHHLSFRVSNYDAAINTLKDKKIEYFEKTQQEGKVKQCFFFDPDGNGLEIGNWPIPT